MAKLDHVAFNVKDVYTAVQWYMQNLGAQLEYQDDTWAMLNIDGSKIALTVPEQHPPHVAFTIDSFDDFPAGLEIKQHRDGSFYVYQQDYDKNIIELIYWPKDLKSGEEKKK